MALVGSGVMVMFQFTLFLLVGSAIWAAGLAPAGMAGDELFPAYYALNDAQRKVSMPY